MYSAIKSCPKHGSLDKEQCYIRRNGKLECKECTKNRISRNYKNNYEAINQLRKLKYLNEDYRAQILKRMTRFYATNTELVSNRVRAHKLNLKKEVLSHYSFGELPTNISSIVS